MNRYDEFIFGGIAYSVSIIGLYPLHKTIFFQQLDGISWIQSLNRLKSEGFGVLYRGVLAPLVQRSLSGSLMFGVQGNVERVLIKNIYINYNSVLPEKILSSICAGCFEAVLLPFERVQTLLINKNYHNQYKHTFHALTNLRSSLGIVELYRGLTPVLCRNCLGNSLYFCGHYLLNGVRKRRSNESTIERGLWNFVLGGLLGGCISSITFPFNVAKTRMQSKVGGCFDSLGFTFIVLINEEFNKPNIFRLYRGLPANFVRSIFSWGLITMTYQLILEIYSD